MVLIWSKSAGKIARKSLFEIRKRFSSSLSWHVTFYSLSWFEKHAANRPYACLLAACCLLACRVPAPSAAGCPAPGRLRRHRFAGLHAKCAKAASSSKQQAAASGSSQDKLEGRFSKKPIVKLRPIFPTDFDDIKTANWHDSDPQMVLIWSKSARKIGGK